MGGGHALSGLAVGAATLPIAPLTGTGMQLAWVAAWGGFALLPDLDSGGWTMRGGRPRGHGSTVARMWGPPTITLAGAVGTLARGHRNGTHDVVLAPVVFGAIAYGLGLHPWTSLVGLAFAVGLALHACHFVIPGGAERTAWGNVILSFAAAFWFTGTGEDAAPWLPLAVAGGVLVHIAGDALTVGGCPVPFTWLDGRSKRYSLRAFRTGSPVETRLLSPVMAVVTVWLLHRNTVLSEWTEPVVAATRDLLLTVAGGALALALHVSPLS